MDGRIDPYEFWLLSLMITSFPSLPILPEHPRAEVILRDMVRSFHWYQGNVEVEQTHILCSEDDGGCSRHYRMAR